ncbi:MAG: hypothetical protein AAF598_10265, partial [Bacteroidota bacterium]
MKNLLPLCLWMSLMWCFSPNYSIGQQYLSQFTWSDSLYIQSNERIIRTYSGEDGSSALLKETRTDWFVSSYHLIVLDQDLMVQKELLLQDGITHRNQLFLDVLPIGETLYVLYQKKQKKQKIIQLLVKAINKKDWTLATDPQLIYTLNYRGNYGFGFTNYRPHIEVGWSENGNYFFVKPYNSDWSDLRFKSTKTILFNSRFEILAMIPDGQDKSATHLGNYSIDNAGNFYSIVKGPNRIKLSRFNPKTQVNTVTDLGHKGQKTWDSKYLTDKVDNHIIVSLVDRAINLANGAQTHELHLVKYHPASD